MELNFIPIGIIHTPYKEDAPYRDYENKEGEFYVELNKEFTEGLHLLY